MAMGRRKRDRQEPLFITAQDLPRSAGHPFYRALNGLLAGADFDRWVEARCARFYEQEEKRGQPSIPPGVYFRMLLVGYFEGIDSQRGIAWRCADSLALREFLGTPLTEQTPEHSTLTNTRKRLPKEVFDEVFQFVLKLAVHEKLLSGKTVGVDSTTLEANAAMKSIVRRDTGETWKAYVTRLMREEGVIEEDHEPSDEKVRRYDKGRKDKKVGNDEWVSQTDPASRITQMKDGRTHLAYKAEHVVDLASDLVLAAEIYKADQADTRTLVDSVIEAQIHVHEACGSMPIEEVVADKGYHSAATLELCDAYSFRSYIPEPRRLHDRNWAEKPADYQRCFRNNRRRVKRAKSKRLQRCRSERCERTFAHICDSGGMRRSWLRGLADVSKRYTIAAAAHNLGRIMRSLFGIGKPRVLQGEGGVSSLAQILIARVLAALTGLVALAMPPMRPRLFTAR
jgi:transposase